MRCRSGFATEQAAYQEAQADLERGLADVEARLSRGRFLLGDKFTDADLRLLPTVARYDAVYNSLFRCAPKILAQKLESGARLCSWAFPPSPPIRVSRCNSSKAMRKDCAPRKRSELLSCERGQPGEGIQLEI